MEIGDIVISKAGHDKDKPFVVIAVMNEDFVLIADGQSRTTEAPKLKRKRHLRVQGHTDLKIPTNASLKKSIKQFNSDRR